MADKDAVGSLWQASWAALVSQMVKNLPAVQENQVPLSMEFSRQEYWSGEPFPSPGDLPDPGIEPGLSALQADS